MSQSLNSMFLTTYFAQTTANYNNNLPTTSSSSAGTDVYETQPDSLIWLLIPGLAIVMCIPVTIQAIIKINGMRKSFVMPKIFRCLWSRCTQGLADSRSMLLPVSNDPQLKRRAKAMKKMRKKMLTEAGIHSGFSRPVYTVRKQSTLNLINDPESKWILDSLKICNGWKTKAPEFTSPHSTGTIEDTINPEMLTKNIQFIQTLGKKRLVLSTISAPVRPDSWIITHGYCKVKGKRKKLFAHTPSATPTMTEEEQGYSAEKIYFKAASQLTPKLISSIAKKIVRIFLSLGGEITMLSGVSDFQQMFSPCSNHPDYSKAHKAVNKLMEELYLTAPDMKTYEQLCQKLFDTVLKYCFKHLSHEMQERLDRRRISKAVKKDGNEVVSFMTK